MCPDENELYSMKLPGPIPFPLLASRMVSDVDLSPTQYKRIALLNLTYFKSVANLEISYIDQLYEIIDDLAKKG